MKNNIPLCCSEGGDEISKSALKLIIHNNTIKVIAATAMIF